MDNFVGQRSLIESLKISAAAAKMRKEAMRHVLLMGPHGSGKNTIAKALANELNKELRVMSFNTIRTTSELAAALSSINDGDVLLAENFDSIKNDCIEIMRTVLEDFCLDVVVGKGIAARNIRLDLPQFTLVATMDKQRYLPDKFKDCFFINWVMENYSSKELRTLAIKYAKEMAIDITDEACGEIADHSNGSYQQLTRILKRSRDFALVKGNGVIDANVVQAAIEVFLV